MGREKNAKQGVLTETLPFGEDNIAAVLSHLELEDPDQLLV